MRSCAIIHPLHLELGTAPLIPVKTEMLHKIENIHAMERTKLYV